MPIVVVAAAQSVATRWLADAGADDLQAFFALSSVLMRMTLMSSVSDACHYYGPNLHVRSRKAIT